MTEEQIQENLQKVHDCVYLEQRERLHGDVCQVALNGGDVIDWQALKRYLRSVNDEIDAIKYIGNHHSPNFLDGIFSAFQMFHDDFREFPLGYFVRHDQWARRSKQKRLTGSVLETIQSVFQGTLDEFLVTRIGIHEALKDSVRGIEQLFELKTLDDSIYAPADLWGASFKHLPDNVRGKNYQLNAQERVEVRQQIEERQMHQMRLDVWLRRLEGSQEEYRYVKSVFGVNKILGMLRHNAVEIVSLEKVYNLGVVPDSVPSAETAETGVQVGRIALNTARKQSEKQSVSNIVRILETARENRLFSDETSLSDLARILWVDGVQYTGEKYSNLRGRIYNNKDKHSGKTDSSLFADFVFDCFEQMSAAKKKEFRERIKRPSDSTE